MILVDTSIWIEFLKRNSPTFEHMLLLLEQGEIVTIEAILTASESSSAKIWALDKKLGIVAGRNSY